MPSCVCLCVTRRGKTAIHQWVTGQSLPDLLHGRGEDQPTEAKGRSVNGNSVILLEIIEHHDFCSVTRPHVRLLVVLIISIG